jgi:hypothetical protein
MPLPLPPPLARAALRGLNSAGITATPARSSTTFTTPGWRMGRGPGPSSGSGRDSGDARPRPR